MKLVQHYSHLNGLEWLNHHHPTHWQEICDAIAAVDATLCKTKVSNEKTMRGKILFSPNGLNAAFKVALTQRGWGSPPRNYYYVTDDPDITRSIIGEPLVTQERILREAGKELIKTYNAADFEKDRVSVEVQFGKYSFVQFDLFIKHAANYMHGRIDLGIEIVPMKAMERGMSSGPPYYEKHLHEILRQGRIFPPVPLILIGVEP